MPPSWSTPFVTGMLYTTPDARWGPIQGIYVLHCGLTFSFNDQAYDGPNFILKVGKAIDIRERVAQHKSETSEYGCKGTVTFLFGLEVQGVDLSGAESLLKSRLTYFGFAQYVVTETQKRTTETFAFNVKSLPLIHDVVCAIRYAYRLPAERKSKDHENSIANPLLSQGLGRYQDMPEPPEMPEPSEMLEPPERWPPATAPAARGLQYEIQGPDWDVPEPPEDLQRLPPEDLQTMLQGPGWEQPMDHS